MAEKEADGESKRVVGGQVAVGAEEALGVGGELECLESQNTGSTTEGMPQA